MPARGRSSSNWYDRRRQQRRQRGATVATDDCLAGGERSRRNWPSKANTSKPASPSTASRNLSTVWLMLELYPEDAARIRFGQRVEAEMQSLPGTTFDGRVAFIDRVVDPRKRTVGVRVEFLNEDRSLRPGDYAQATIFLAIGEQGRKSTTLVLPGGGSAQCTRRSSATSQATARSAAWMNCQRRVTAIQETPVRQPTIA